MRRRSFVPGRILAPLGVLLLTAAAPLAAQQPASAPAPRTIRVSATGEARAQPDQAYLDFAVETAATTAKAASEENAKLMDRVVRALVAAGVPRERIETRNFTVYPEYTSPTPGERQDEPRIRGYRTSNMVTARVDDLKRVGALIDAALGAGANRVDAVRFGLRNPERAQAEATRDAVQRARANAETIASALGVRLGEVLDASTAYEPYRPYAADMRMYSMRAEAAAAPTPIQPAEQTVNSTVTLVYAIAR
jgi:uncharacterized protein YggE